MMLVRRAGMTTALAAALVLVTPVIMLTADGAEKAASRAADAGSTTYEDAEDAAAKAGDKWKLIRRIHRATSSVTYVRDEERKSRVVEFKSTGVARTTWIKESWFAELLEQGYVFKADDLMQAKLLKEGVIQKDDKGNYRFVPKILAITDRYKFRDYLKTLPTTFTDDEITVTLSLWARCHGMRRPKYSMTIDQPVAEGEEVEVEWAMRFDPTSWDSKSFTVYVQVETDGGIKHMFHYLKATHVADLENQEEEKKYKWAKRDVIFYWRLLDEWQTEEGPIRRGTYVRALLDSQLARQTPADGWYVFRCNLSENLRNAKHMYSRDKTGAPKRKLQKARIKKIKSFDVSAGDCRLDDVRIIVTKK